MEQHWSGHKAKPQWPAGEQSDVECENTQTGLLLDKEDSWKPYFEGQKETKIDQRKDLSHRNV